MKKIKITLEDVIEVTQKGFERLDTKIDNIELRLDKVDGRLDKIDIKLDRVENLLIRDQNNKIERIQDDIRILKTAAGK